MLRFPRFGKDLPMPCRLRHGDIFLGFVRQYGHSTGSPCSVSIYTTYYCEEHTCFTMELGLGCRSVVQCRSLEVDSGSLVPCSASVRSRRRVPGRRRCMTGHFSSCRRRLQALLVSFHFSDQMWCDNKRTKYRSGYSFNLTERRAKRPKLSMLAVWFGPSRVRSRPAGNLCASHPIPQCWSAREYYSLSAAWHVRLGAERAIGGEAIALLAIP